MGNELLDFKQQDNFDFFKFSTYYGKGDGNSKEAQEKLKRDCNGVLEYVHAMDNDMCLLSYRLLELKQSGTWQNVINPETGCSFWNHTFDEFCFYAFGFSKTRTSNHLRIAQFVQLTGGKAGFIDERYVGFSRSQLVELAPVPPSNRHYFNRKMTVSEMRIIKDYMKMGGFFQDKFEEDFEILSYAKAWKEQKSLPSAPQPLPPADVIPGQIDLSEMEEIAEVDELSETPQECAAPISDCEKARQDVELSNEAEGFVETFQEPSSDSDENEEIISDVENREESPSVQSEYEPFELVKGMSPWFKHDFKNRDGIREFYFGYRNWEKLYSAIPFIDVYRYKFKIGTLYAVSVQQASLLDEPSEREVKAVVRYYWQKKGDPLFCCYETSKIELETFIPLHKDEL